jgi:integrase
MKLTNETVRTIKLMTGQGDLIVFDEKLSGFGFRVRRGSKGINQTWVIQYRDALRKSRRFIIGTLDELNAAKAREVAADMLANIRLGVYPHAEREKTRDLAEKERDKDTETFATVGNLYLANRRKHLRERSFEEVRRHIEKNWSPFARTSIHQINRRMIALRITEIATNHGLVTANRARAALSAMFGWAMREGIVEQNPVIATNKAVEEMSRDRVLTDTELAEIWAASRDDDYGRITRLLMLTAQRREEVGAMLWSELDLDREVWVLSGERTKNKRPHVVPLAPLAISILNAVPRRERNRVFGEGEDGFYGWSWAKERLDHRINQARAGEGNLNPITAWRLHDLRRTAATVMADKLGVQPHIVEALLNHVSGHKAGVAGVYNRAGYEREVRAALLVWADHLESIIHGAERKIVPLPMRGGHERR